MSGIPVRYNAVFGIGIFVAGTFILIAGLLLGRFLLLTVGFINTLAGFGFITQPWFVVFPDRIEVRNLLGRTIKQHPIGGFAELEVQDGRVWSKRNDAPFRGLGGWLARASDVAAIGRASQSADETIGR